MSDGRQGSTDLITDGRGRVLRAEWRLQWQSLGQARGYKPIVIPLQIFVAYRKSTSGLVGINTTSRSSRQISSILLTINNGEYFVFAIPPCHRFAIRFAP